MLDGLPITIADLVVVGGIVLFAVIASFWGLIGLVTGIGAWIGAGAIAILYYPEAQDLARDYIETAIFADLAAGIGLFAAALVVFLVISAILSHLVKESALGSLNRALGFVAGAALGYTMACVLLIGGILVFTEAELPSSVRDARLYPVVRAGGVALLATVPEELRTEGLNELQRAKRGVDEAERAKDLYDSLNAPSPEGGAGSEDGANGSGEHGYAPDQNDQVDDLTDRVEPQ